MVMMGVVLLAQDALAVGGEFGILEGRSFALIHPIVMGSFFLYTLWAGYLGWQWRRVRTIQNDINDLKKQVKPNPVTPDGKPVEEAAPSPVELQIQQLTEVGTKSVLKQYNVCLSAYPDLYHYTNNLDNAIACGCFINFWMLDYNGSQ